MRGKRVIVWGCVAAGVVAVGLLATWGYIGRSGTSDLEQWLGQQIVGILNSHINPAVSFDELDYQAPRTVVVRNLRLRVAEQEILAVDRLLLALAEVPRRGRPIQIEQVELDQPHVQLLTTADGGLLGWESFVREEIAEDPQNAPPGLRLSDVLVLRHVAIRGGEVVYIDAPGGAEPMRLPGIELELDTPPASEEPGWYALIGTFERAPVLAAAIDGRINLDSGVLDLREFRLQAALEEEEYASLPPALQRFLRQYAVRGRLSGSFTGRVPLNNPELSQGLAAVRLERADFAQNEVACSLGALEAELRLPGGELKTKLDDLTLRAEGVEPFAARAVQARLQLPLGGESFAVRELTIASPRVVLAGDQAGEWLGWRKLAPTGTPPATAPAAEEENASRTVRRLLESVDWLEIKQGAVVHKAWGAAAYAVENISFQFSGEAAASQPATGVGRALRATVTIGEHFTAALRGWLDPVAPVLTLASAEVRGTVEPATYGLLPPEVADWLAQYEVQGRVVLNGEGRIPLSDPAAAEVRVHAEISDGQAVWAGVQIPVVMARLEADLPAGGVRVTAGPLALRSGGTEFFALEQVKIELAGVPSDGQPLVINRVDLQGPHARFETLADGTWAGWSELAALRSASGGPEAAPTGRKQVELPVLRALRVRDAAVTYAGDDAPPVTLGEIGLELRSEPAGADRQAVTARLTRAPLMAAELVGTLDSAAQQLTVERLQLHADATDAAAPALPAPVRDWLSTHGVSGAVAATAQGTVPLRDWRAATGSVAVSLRDLQFAAHEVAFPLEEVRVAATLPDGPVEVIAEDVRAVDMQSGALLRVERAAVELSGGLRDWTAGLRVRRVVLDQPHVRLAYGSDGELRGWTRLLGGRDAAGTDDVQPAQRAPAPAALPPLPDVLEMQDAEIQLVAVPGAEPVVLDGIDLRVTTEATDSPQVRTVRAELTRAEDLRLTLAGRLDGRRSMLAVEQSDVRIALTAAQLGVIPGISKVLNVQRTSGTLLASFAGSVPLGNPAQASGELILDVRDARVATDHGEFPAQRVQARVQLPEGPVALSGTGLAWERGGNQLVRLPEIRLEASNVPWAGQPFDVRSVRLESPRLVLAAGEPVGPADRPQTSRSTPQGSGANFELMQRFRLALLEVENGELSYGRAAGAPLLIDGIAARLRLPPAEKPGWYDLQVSVQRPPVLDVQLAGQVNLEEAILDLTQIKLQAGLNAEQYEKLPSGLRELARAHELQGQLRVQGRVRVPWNSPERASGALQMTLSGGRLALDRTVWPIEQARIDTEIAKGQAEARYALDLLGGSLGGTASVGLAAPYKLEFAWDVQKVQLAKMLRAVQQRRPAYSGRLATTGKLRGELERMPESLQGRGTVQVSEGQLLALPIISQVAQLVSGKQLGLELEMRDSGRAELEITGTHVNITDAGVQSPLLEMRGQGQIHYDGRLDLQVNAGLFERLQSRFGAIGKIVGEVTDRTMVYRVEGTLAAPKVSVSPLGL